MRRHLTSRILLSFLLLWQLGAGMFVHAHGVATSHMQHAAQVPEMAPKMATETELMTHEHCGEHDAAMMHADAGDAMQMDMTMHGAMHEAVYEDSAMHAHDSSSHASSQPDCCQSLLCKCPCLQALALSISLPYMATGLPDSPIALTPVSPLLHAGVSGLFRPPI